MINVFYGDDKNNLAYEIHKVVDYHNNAQIQHLYFDDNHQEIIDQICQTDLFATSKVFIVHDATFLLSDKPKELDLSQKICSVAEQDIYLSINTKKETFNKFAKQVNLKKISKFTLASKKSLINNLIKQSKMSFQNNSAYDLFENTVSNDPFMIETEVDKLLLAANNGIISKSIVEKLINNSAELNIFKMTNYLLTNNKEQLIKLYDSLIMLKYQPIELIQIMSSQLFNLKLLKQAVIEHYSQTMIEEQLKITKFVQYANRDTLNNISLEKIDQTIFALTLLDYNIKHSLINPYLGLKLMLTK
ncbi:MAG: hypothetical protein LBJ97_03360 [Mycoplasmataceae bacterium]|jgi:DNA polymerase-3 subunit delta|nr:hypothetical protein [Mycoplasmataceae bacterium]